MPQKRNAFAPSFNRLLGSVALLFAVATVSAPSHAELIFEFDFTDGVTTIMAEIVVPFDNRSEQFATSLSFSGLPTDFFPTGTFDFTEGDPFFENTFDVVDLELGFSEFIQSTPRPNPFLTFVHAVNTVTGDVRTELQLFPGGPVGEAVNFLIGTDPSFARLSPPPLNSVPEPTPMALLGAGGIAFGLLRRKKRNIVA